MRSKMTDQELKAIAEKNGTPVYVYDGAWLKKHAESLLSACGKIGCLPRYAAKANPHKEIVLLLDSLGLHFDASSDYEAELLISYGIKPEKISLSSQQPPRDMAKTLASGLRFVATSMHQLELIAQSGFTGSIAVRVNPGVGAGHSKRVTTEGLSSSFGIWHEYLPDILHWQQSSGIKIDRLHVHIGAGVEPDIWRGVMQQSLEIVDQMSDVTTLDIGGGYKVGRMPGENETDMSKVMEVFGEELEVFRQRTGRELALEVEPGTWIAANCGQLLSRITDIVDTGSEGYRFLKLDTGMNDLLRPSLYGAQHEIRVINDSEEKSEYVVVGHNCESGDILTPAPGQPEEIMPRSLNMAHIGDLVSISGAGAYCASMSAKGYNSFPPATEVMV